MEEEIISLGDLVYENNGKTWLNVAITFKGLNQLNKMVLGDIPDEGTDQEKLRQQVHKDCLRLFKEFKK